jgi:hypothetical protein
MTNPLPPLSELLSWSTTHLSAGADYWDGLADRWKDAFNEVHHRLRASGWEGQAYDATDERTYWDSAIVGNAADDLHDGARTARDAASDVTAAQDRLRESVTKARDAGFDVGDNYTVTSRETYSTPAQQTQLQAQAESLAEDIRWRATALVDTDQHAGARVTHAVGHLGNLTFDEHDGPGTPANGNSEPNGVQLVDYFGPKQSPIPDPSLPDDPVGRGGSPSAADIRSVLEKLPQGDRPWIREVRTPEDLQRLWKWMEQNGIEDPSRYGDPSKGVWKNLPDGSGVGQRSSAGSTKAPALDINLNGGDHWKVHINPGTGGIPEIPAAPRPSIEAAPGRGAAPGAVPGTVIEPPAEPKAPPARGGPLGGFPLGGGALPDGSLPYFVEPPGPDATGPDLPVIGDGKPDIPEVER